jgi:hypothetical protein
MPRPHFGPESEPFGGSVDAAGGLLAVPGTPLEPQGNRMDKPHRVGAPTVERANGYKDGYQD